MRSHFVSRCHLGSVAERLSKKSNPIPFCEFSRLESVCRRVLHKGPYYELRDARFQSKGTVN